MEIAVEGVDASQKQTSLRPRGLMIKEAYNKAVADLQSATAALESAKKKQEKYDADPDSVEDAWAELAAEMASQKPDNSERQAKQKATNEWKGMTVEAQQRALADKTAISFDKNGKPRDIYIKPLKSVK